MEELPFFEVVAGCEDDGRHEAVEEDVVVEVEGIELVAVDEVDEHAYEPAHDDADSGLVQEVDLRSELPDLKSLNDPADQDVHKYQHDHEKHDDLKGLQHGLDDIVILPK